MLPYFYCNESGHEPNLLDSVCMDPTCVYKGLSCVRCVHNKHATQKDKIISQGVDEQTMN